MYCPKCGHELPEGSKFCSACGARIPDFTSENRETPGEAEKTHTEAELKETASSGEAIQAEAEGRTEDESNQASEPATAAGTKPASKPIGGAESKQVSEPAGAASASSESVSEDHAARDPLMASAAVKGGNSCENIVKAGNRNKRKLYTAIAACIAAVLLIFAAFAVWTLFFSDSGSKNAYACLSDGKYEMITNLKKGTSVELSSVKSEDTESDLDQLLQFSPDGKYVYYYTKFDEGSYTGTLCRAEYGKVKGNSAKNDKYIKIIDTDVRMGFEMMEDGSAVYVTEDGTLYHFNGKESERIDDEVLTVDTDGKERLVYEAGNDSDGYRLYGVSLSKPDDKIRMDSDVSYIYDSDDFENIVYVKHNDDGGDSLYTAGFSKEAEKLADDVKDLYDVGNKTYFTAPNGKTLNLYDYVDDPDAAADEGLTEPQTEDFSVPYYNYYMIIGSNLSEDDYSDLYTSCTKPLYWYGENSWWSYSMEDALDMSWGPNSDAILQATQAFIDKYKDSEDENGYIKVTDDVKAMLQAINNAQEDAGDKQWQWLWLCCTRTQYGTTTDWEAYDEAYDKWNAAKDRISLRTELKDPDNAYPVQTLYSLEDGKLTPVNENVLNLSYNGGLFFNTVDMVSKVRMEDEVSGMYSPFEIKEDAENYLVMGDGSVNRMSASAAEAYGKAETDGFAVLYATGKNLFMQTADNELSVAAVRDGIVGDFSTISDDAEVMSADDSVLYYGNELYEDHGMEYCDLYSYSDGNSKLLAKDVIPYDMKVYDDGKIIASTGMHGWNYDYTLFDSKGNSDLIGEEVSQLIRLNESTILYISDNDLYSYDGKDHKKVKNDVDWIWSKDSMESRELYGGEA